MNDCSILIPSEGQWWRVPDADLRVLAASSNEAAKQAQEEVLRREKEGWGRKAKQFRHPDWK